MADIANGIAENKNLRVCAEWCKSLDWVAHVANACSMELYFNGTTLALTGGFTLFIVAPTPLSIHRLVAFFFVFGGQTLSVSIGGASVALYG